ncbi:MAG: EpsG family protein [Solobacterium sp.]|nr:EpsG family protein [Solobacterium sp.]
MTTSIGLYTIIWIVASLIVLYQYVHREKKSSLYDIRSGLYAKKKLSIVAVICIAGLFTLYNVFVTSTSVVMGSDRLNYVANFNGLRTSPSISLMFLMHIIHRVNGSIETLFYFTTFFCVFLTLIAYRRSKDATPLSFVLLCVTQYFLITLTAIKQSYTSAFAVLFFVLILEYKSKKASFLAIACIILACLFHTTGYVLIPLYIMVKSPKNRYNLFIYGIVLLILVFAFEPAMLALARIVTPIIPRLGGQLTAYFSDTSGNASDGIAISFIKGLPYYFITIYAVFKRNTLKDRINNYDNYLLVIATGSFLYFVSIYSGWLSRFVHLFSFVSFVFFGLLMKEVRIPSNRTIYKGFMFVSLAIETYRFLYLVYALWGGF